MGNYRMAHPVNEPIFSYAPGTPERAKLQAAIADLKSKQIDVPLIINGKEVRVGEKIKMTAPHDHNLVLGYTYKGTKKETQDAIAAALAAQKSWSEVPMQSGCGKVENTGWVSGRFAADRGSGGAGSAEKLVRGPNAAPHRSFLESRRSSRRSLSLHRQCGDDARTFQESIPIRN